MNRRYALALVWNNLRSARLRVLLLVALLVAGLSGRMLYGYFFGSLVSQAAAAGEERGVPLVVLLPPGQDAAALLEAPAIQWRAGIGYVSGSLVPLYTAAGRLDFLGTDWAALLALYPGCVEVVSGRLPAAAGEVALPAVLAGALGLGVGDVFPAAAGFSAGEWTQWRVVGVFTASARSPLPPALLEVPATTLAPAAKPNLAVVHTVTPIYRGWQRTADPSTLASALRDLYARQWLEKANGWWGWDQLPLVVSGDYARRVTTGLAAGIYCGTRRVLGMGYAFVALGIYSVLLVAIIQRKRELAIHKTVGLSPRQLLLVYGLEIVLVSALAFALGCVVVGWWGARVAAVMGVETGVTAVAVLQSLATVGTLVVLASALPLAMAGAATVNQLLYGQKLYVFTRRVEMREEGGDR